MTEIPDRTRQGISRRDLLRAGATVAGAIAVGAVQTELVYAQDGGEEVTVTIQRDNYGVPHIYARDANNRAPVFYGYGYATARDRMFQCEMWRRYYRGTVAEALGRGDEQNWVQFDTESRRSTAGEPSIPDQAEEQMTEDQREVIQAFTDGINRYIREVKQGDSRAFAKGFQDNEFEPEEFSFADTAGMFVASMSFFSGFQLETLNSSLLEVLTASAGDRDTALEIFSDANWRNDPGSPTSTIQSDEGYIPPYTDAETGETEQYEPQERIEPGEQNLTRNEITGGNITVLDNSQAVHRAEVERKRTVAEGLESLGLTYKTGSYALAVHGDITESGDALLFGGPQMDYSTPSVMYEAGLHGPDFDVAGITVAGYPFIMFGHNRNGAFTSTAGIDNCLQTFEVDITVNEDGPDTYMFQGEQEEIETVEKTVEVADGENETYTERFTRHGVVTQYNPEQGQVIVETRSYAGRHMRCLNAYYEAQFAGSVEEFRDAAVQCDYALNFLWADRNGDIGYFHLGRYPDFESVEWDTRFPADGNQFELTDDDYLLAEDGEVPYSINPPAGYSAGWNNKPAPNWNAGDLNYNYSTDHRVQRIINLVERRLDETGTVDYSYMKEISEDISFVDLRSIRFKQDVLDALADADLTDTEAAARAELEEWGHIGRADGPDDLGQYPAGFTIWREIFSNVLSEVYGPVYGDAASLALVLLGDDYGKGTLMRLLNEDETSLDTADAANYANGDVQGALVSAFRTAVEDLGEQFGGDPSGWRADADVDPLSTITLFGVPVNVTTAGSMASMNRGTEEHIVQLGEEITAENILPPGNGGYVAPDGSTGEHFNDQLQMFKNFEYKPLRFDDDTVDGATETTQDLLFQVEEVEDEDGTDDGTDDGGDNGTDDASGPGFSAVTGVAAVLSSALYWLHSREEDNES